MSSEQESAAAELKRKRLDAWRKRLQEQQQQPKPIISTSSAGASSSTPSETSSKLKLAKGFSINFNSNKKSGKRNLSTSKNDSASLWGSEDEADTQRGNKNGGLSDGLISLNTPSKNSEKDLNDLLPQKQKRNRWDSNPMVVDGPLNVTNDSSLAVQKIQTISEVDALDQFMDHLNAGAMGSVTIQDSSLSINVSGSMIAETRQTKLPQHSGGIITFDDLKQLKQGSESIRKTDANTVYGPSDWESETVCNLGLCINFSALALF